MFENPTGKVVISSKNSRLLKIMSASGKSLLGLWLYRSGEQEWALKEGSPIHKAKDFIVNINLVYYTNSLECIRFCRLTEGRAHHWDYATELWSDINYFHSETSSGRIGSSSPSVSRVGHKCSSYRVAFRKRKWNGKISCRVTSIDSEGIFTWNAFSSWCLSEHEWKHLHWLIKILLFPFIKGDVLVDIECDSKYLDHVVRRLKREGNKRMDHFFSLK